jgi:MFS family permease
MKFKLPLIPHPSQLFYGWYIVLGLGTVGMVSVGMGGVNFGLFMPLMSEDLGIKQAYFGWAYTARITGFSLSSWFIGKMLDKHGARVPMAVAGVLMCLIMIGISQITAGWQLIALFFLIGFIGMHGGGSNLYQAVPLSRWFVEQRGKAMSITFLGSIIGVFIFSPIAQYLIDDRGWRSAWLILGCGGSIVVSLVAVFIIRKDPESMGLLPDGYKVEERESESDAFAEASSQGEISWNLSQATRSVTFWGLVLITGMIQLSFSTFMMFRIPHYIEQGIPASLVAWALSTEAVVGGLTTIFISRISDRFHSRYIIMWSLVALIGAIFVSIVSSEVWHVYLATALMGITVVIMVVGQGKIWPDFFGSENIGSIRGLVNVVTVGFTAIGAPITGIVKDRTGSYLYAWLMSIIVLIISVFLLALLKKPILLPTN